MQRIAKNALSIAAAALLVTTVLAGGPARAQEKEKQKPEYFQAQAYGQGTQMGRNFNVTVIIQEYSTAEDQQILIKAFEAKGMQALTNVLYKMKTKGRLAITGTLGYDVSYVRSVRTDEGRRIRLITNRPINFAEAWEDGRSTDYNLSALELNISDVKGKSAGTLLPACQFKINKDKELEIEAFQNPWTLRDVMQR
ncbi:MAG TPA: hypothetical protein VKG84_01075 [Candidatus Acidoferrales bacterium]|nr:hypothetical protein [Candidatus Acidoferrales bacterium]